MKTLKAIPKLYYDLFDEDKVMTSLMGDARGHELFQEYHLYCSHTNDVLDVHNTSVYSIAGWKPVYNNYKPQDLTYDEIVKVIADLIIRPGQLLYIGIDKECIGIPNIYELHAAEGL